MQANWELNRHRGNSSGPRRGRERSGARSREWQRELGIGRTSAGIRVEVEVEIGLLQLPVAQTFPAPFRIFLLDFYKDYVYMCHCVYVCVCRHVCMYEVLAFFE